MSKEKNPTKIYKKPSGMNIEAADNAATAAYAKENGWKEVKAAKKQAKKPAETDPAE